MAELSYPAAAALTLACEVPVYVAVLSRWGGAPLRRSVLIGLVVNVVSHPTLWFVLVPAIRDRTGSHWIAVAIAEAIVWNAEGIGAALLLRVRPGDPIREPLALGLAASYAANTLSLGAGLIVLSLLGA